MKTVFVAILLFALFSSKAFCQKITYRELIGTWDKSGTAKEKLTFKFIDSSNIVVQSTLGGSSNMTYKLITDSLKDQNIILINSNTDGIKTSNNYAIHLINANTLKLANLDFNDAIAQKPPEVNKGTFYLARRN